MIVGNSGSGIDLETASASVSVINNSGAIIGKSTGSGPLGIGINVAGLAELDNSGLIQAGTTNPNQAAVSIGGGEINNEAGGTITSSEAAIIVDGGTTFNNVPLDAFGAVTIDNSGTIQGDNGEAILIVGDFDDTLTNFGAILGSVSLGGGDDVVNLYTGSSISGLLDGGPGNDTVNLLGSGVGTLASFANIESINLNGGDWTLGSEGINDLVFGPGLETLRLTSGVLADGTFSGTIDHFAPGDVIDLEGIGLASGVSLGAGNLLTVSGTSVGLITLQLGATDNFSGDAFAVSSDGDGGTLLTLGEVISGGNGNAVINGSPGGDIITAGNGNDIVNGGAGNDIVEIGNGNDTINDGDGNDAITTGNGRDTIDVGNGNDAVTVGNGNDIINLGNGTDSVTVGNGNDTINLGNGTDTVTAGNGNDTINGGPGNDTIKVGNGNDIITGGAGNDVITAGNGNDTFVFSAGFGNDTINGFHSGDHIEFDDNLFANFAAVQDASHQVGSDTVITLDAGDTITLTHTSVSSLHASEFILT
jgi:hypothetical protein